MPKPQIYLSHSIRDSDRVGPIYQRLLDLGFKPWWFDRDIAPGEDWARSIEHAIAASDVFLALVSNDWIDPSGTDPVLGFSSGSSLSSEPAPEPKRMRYFQTEVAFATAAGQARSANEVFVIPVRLEPCRVPEPLAAIKWVDLFDDSGWPELLRAIRQAVAEPELPGPLPADALVDAFVTGDAPPMVYVGSGLSAPMGLPMWGELARRLLEWAETRALFGESWDLVQGLYRALEAGDADLVVDNVTEAARAAGVEPALWEYLRSIYIAPAPLPGPNHDRLRKLGFGGALTTNFDDLLEQAFVGVPVYTFRDTEPLLEALSRRQRFVLKLYGALDRTPGEPFIMAPRQYEDEIAGNLDFSKFIESVFVSRTLLFIGASLDGIEAYLRGIKFRGRLSRKHYALVGVTGSAWRAKAQALLRRYQIEVTPYTPSVDHHEVDDFLQTLLERVNERRGSSEPVRPRRRDPARLSSLTLTNIGPFDHLQLPLDASWNILLGDNGVGKSNILRAIAAALCPAEAQPYADRLLRIGQPTGQVILHFDDGRDHVTELFRTSSGVELRSPGGRLFEAEGWLALGFPALRTVTWRRSRGPQLDEGIKRPNAEDLLPILTGGPDPRTDQLKQWIVNIDYRIKSAEAKPADPEAGRVLNSISYDAYQEFYDERNRRAAPETGDEPQEKPRSRYLDLLNEFFHVINRLTSPLVVQFESVDPVRGKVFVRTADGVVPIESLSQGTVSLLGWIGVLLERLYEVYDDVPDPHNQFALVLMDEIDAHMHPAWQQALVPALSDLFPDIQFMATTHSPLIVSGIKVDQVARLARGDDGRINLVKLEPDMTMGRADQVLTGGLFGLETTLDEKTRDAIAEYQKLLVMRPASPREQKERDEKLRKAQAVLAFRIPAPYEAPEERRALELFQTLMRTQLDDEHPEVQAELSARAERLLTEVAALMRKRRKGTPP